MPAGAELWTAVVNGEPVKPVPGPAKATPAQVLIPLVKTAAGDLDYVATLKYGGKTDALGRIGSVNFPLVHTKNINVERSIVELRLPQTYRWLNFGGTMHPGEEADATAAVLSYQTKQTQRLMEAMQRSDPYAQQRAKYNIKAYSEAVKEFRQRVSGLAAGNASAETEMRINGGVLDDAGRLLKRADQATAQAAQQDSSRKDVLLGVLGHNYSTRARNVVNSMDLNWDGNKDLGAASSAPAPLQFNGRWFADNDLAANAAAAPNGLYAATAPDSGAQPPQVGMAFRTPGAGFAGRGKANANDRQLLNQPFNPGFAQSPDEEKSASSASKDSYARKSADQKEDVLRYQQKLEQQQKERGRGERIVANSYGATTLNGRRARVPFRGELLYGRLDAQRRHAAIGRR